MESSFNFYNQRIDEIVEQFRTIDPDLHHWSSMPEYFRDHPEPASDPLIYELYSLPYTASPTDLMIVLTVLHAGAIGGEKFHTKGHFHHAPDGAEYVIALAGKGVLERGDHDGVVRESVMEAGTHLIVPPGQAHRVTNTGDEPLAFLSLCSPVVGHDYVSVRRLGWAMASLV